MKIIICGSMIFSKEMLEIKDKLVINGHEVVLPRHVEKYASKELETETASESVKNKIEQDLIRDYYNKIEKGDAVLIANFDKNGIKNYIGGNTFLEMGFAHVLNKKIFLLNPIPEVSYKDEIIAIQPVVLEGNVEKIYKFLNCNF